MLNIELIKENKVSSTGSPYTINIYKVYCEKCHLSIEIKDFNNVILQPCVVENIKVQKTSDNRVVLLSEDGLFEYTVPWNYKTAVLMLNKHSLECKFDVGKE